MMDSEEDRSFRKISPLPSPKPNFQTIPTPSVLWSPPRTGRRGKLDVPLPTIHQRRRSQFGNASVVAPDMLMLPPIPKRSFSQASPINTGPAPHDLNAHRKGECICSFCSTIRRGIQDIQAARGRAKKAGGLLKGLTHHTKGSRPSSKLSKPLPAPEEEDGSEFHFTRALEDEAPEQIPTQCSLEALGIDPRRPRHEEVKRVTRVLMEIGDSMSENAELSCFEMNAFLRHTKYRGFVEWLIGDDEEAGTPALTLTPTIPAPAPTLIPTPQRHTIALKIQ